MTRVPVAAFFALFTVSGFAGLIYESIWSHYLKLFLGHAAYAQTLVLAIFMGGMALGAWLVSRFTLRIRDLLVGYALAELGIGVLAIAFHPVFQGVTTWALESLFPAMGGGGVDVVKWMLASAMILPASLLLGSTFPLMSAGVLRAYPETGGGALAMLYFTNSFGAAAGVLASGFVLIPAVGLPGTILTAGILNIALALAVWLLARRVGAAPPAAPGDLAASGSEARGLARVILLAAFATGAASFIYEITWIRMLSMGLGSSTHAFEIMLAAFILGMSLGALVLRGRMKRMDNDAAWLAAILFAKAFFAVYAVWVYGDVLEFVRWTLAAAARTDQGYALVTVAGLVASMMVMLPAAFCAGMTLPLATHLLARRGHGEATVGRVYAANTAGCIVGAAFTTHVGMELLGVKNLTGLGALVDVAMGLAVLAVGLAAASRRRALAAGAAVAVAGAIAFAAVPLDLLRMTSGVFRFGHFEDPARVKLAYYRDGKTATIAVTDNSDNNRRSIKTNGKTDAALTLGEHARPGPDEGTMILAGAIPLALKPGAATIANIGFGSGLTTHVLLGSPAVREVDTIEIERMVLEGARLFRPRNSRAYDDPRSRIHVDDAKTFFATRGKRYDVIVSEPSNPWVSGVSTLYSREFYAQARRHLADDGLLVQWVHSYEISFDLVASVFKAIGATFGDYGVYRVGTVDLLIVATPGKSLPPMRPDLFGYPGVAADLAYIGFDEVGDLAQLRVGGRAALHGVFERGAVPMNSDYFPVLDQNAPLARYRGDNAHELRSAREGAVPVLAMLDAEVRTPLARVRRARPESAGTVTKARAAAEAVGILLTGRADAAQFLPAEDRSAALLAHGLLDNCEGARRQWLQAVLQVLGLASSVLERADVNIAFERIRASRCHQSLDEVSRARVALLQAINDRDGEAMRRQGEALLARDDPALDAARPMWLMTALTGHLAVGDRARARALWNEHAARLAAPVRGAFPMRILHARLAEGA